MLLSRPFLLLVFGLTGTGAVQAGKMYFTDRGADVVQRADLDGSNVETLVELPGTNLRGIAIHLSAGKIYFCDNTNDLIYRAGLDGSNVEAIVNSNLGFPADLTLEFGSQKLYWCDRNNDRIERASLDGSGRETVIETPEPYYLDLDPDGGKIYWGHFSNGTISRANLSDGSGVEVLVSGLNTVRQVELDLTAGDIYWCDRNAVPSRIQRRGIEGGEIENVYLNLDTPHGMTLDIPAGKIYWVDTGTNNRNGSTGGRSVCRGDMDGSGPIEVLVEGDQPWDIVVDPGINDYTDWRQRHLPASAELDGLADDFDGDGIPNGIAYALGGTLPFLGPNPPAMEYSIRNGVTDLSDLRVEISTDLRAWRHNGDGGDPVTVDFIAPGLPGDPFQHIHTEVLPPFEGSGKIYLRLVLP